MARPASLPFAKFVLRVSDGNSPETFVAPCGLTTRGVNQTAGMQETTVPDCADEAKPAWIERDVDTLSMEIPGSGVLTKEASGLYREWMRSGEGRKCRIYYFDGEDGDGLPVSSIGYDEGFFKMASLNVTGQRGQRVQIEFSLMSDGEIEWHDAPGA